MSGGCTTQRGSSRVPSVLKAELIKFNFTPWMIVSSTKPEFLPSSRTGRPHRFLDWNNPFLGFLVRASQMSVCTHI